MRETLEVFIRQSPVLVWEYLVEPERLAAWRKACTGFERVEELLADDVTAYRFTYNNKGSISQTVESFLHQRPHSTLQVGIDHPLFHLLLSYHLSPVEQGTLLGCIYDLRIKNLWIRMFWQLLKPGIKAGILGEHQRLKNLLEQGEQKKA